VDLSDLAPVGVVAVGTTALTRAVADTLYAPFGSGGGGAGGPVTSDDITDATVVGKGVLTASSPTAARTVIGAGTSSLALGVGPTTAKAGDWQPAAADISDATTLTRSFLQQSSQSAARGAIGAGTSSLAIGSTSTTAKAGDWRPAAVDVSDSTTVGRAVMTAASTTAARTAIGAGTASTKADVGLGSVDNTSDAAKPVSTAQAAAIADKVGLTGDESIAGIKTFLASPSVPVPALDDDAVPKGYVDDAIDTAVPAGSYPVYQATGDDSSLAAALATAPAGAHFVAVKVFGS
jgi:hypothetical protein